MVCEEMGSSVLFPQLVTSKSRRKDIFGFLSVPAGRMLPAAIKIPQWSWGKAQNHEAK